MHMLNLCHIWYDNSLKTSHSKNPYHAINVQYLPSCIRTIVFIILVCILGITSTCWNQEIRFLICPIDGIDLSAGQYNYSHHSHLLFSMAMLLNTHIDSGVMTRECHGFNSKANNIWPIFMQHISKQESLPSKPVFGQSKSFKWYLRSCRSIFSRPCIKLWHTHFALCYSVIWIPIWISVQGQKKEQEPVN